MNEKISEIKELLKQRRTPIIFEKLNELSDDLDKLQEFFDEVKNLCRNQGRSSLVSIDLIEKLLVEYGK